jgi:HEAT repeat protein
MRRTATLAREAAERGDVETLLDLLSSTDRWDRMAAVAHLGQTPDSRVIAALVRGLSSKDEPILIGALKALARIGDNSVTADVYEIATRADIGYPVLATALSTLGALGDPRAGALITVAMARTDLPRARWRAKWAAKELVALNATRAIEDLERARSWKDPITRWRLDRAIKALKRLGV